jgi:hypothetical protein
MKYKYNAGPIMLFGSGETSTSGQKIFDRLLREFPPSPRIALLETPAGFELNSSQVVGKVADFLKHHLQNYNPQPVLIPARAKGTYYSPNSQEVVAPLLEADLLFLGPGSPTYTVRQLEGSLAWKYLLARHQFGAGLALSSAAVIAISTYALPIYEIYKVGENLHWKSGLDLFSIYGLSLTFVPHWNNNDGGSALDTSHCYMGKSRFDKLLDLLPEEQTIVGIDEHTGLYFDCAGGEARVYGKGKVTIFNNENVFKISDGEVIPFEALGQCHEPDLRHVIPAEIWEKTLAFSQAAIKVRAEEEKVPVEINELVKKRETARQEKEWGMADDLRDLIRESGWHVDDTPEGPKLRRVK